MKWHIYIKLLTISVVLLFLPLFFKILFFKIPLSKIPKIVVLLLFGVIGYLLGMWYSWKGIFSLYKGSHKAFLEYIKSFLVLILLFPISFFSEIVNIFSLGFWAGFMHNMLQIFRRVWISKSREDIKEYFEERSRKGIKGCFEEFFEELAKYYRIKSIEDMPKKKT
jgi:hypothetical protein